MLKLTIANALFVNLTANLLRGSAAIQHMELTNKELKETLHNDLVEKAKLLEKDPEVYVKEEKEGRLKRFTRMLGELNTGSIPAIENNKLRIVPSEEEVTIELKSEFVGDFIDTSTNIFIDGLKACAETFLAKRRAFKMLQAFDAKWSEGHGKDVEVDNDTTIVSKVVTAEEVPAEIRSFAEEVGKAGEGTEELTSNLEVGGSTFIADNGVTLKVGSICSDIALDEETILQVHYLNVIAKDGKTYAITPRSVKRILQAQEVNKELQSTIALPYSVMKAIRKAYPTLVAFYAAQQESE